MIYHILFFSVLVYSQICTDEQCNIMRLINNKTIYNDADLIIDNIYLGNICAAHNLTWLNENNISFIINVASEWNEISYEGKNTYYFPFDDSINLDMKKTRQLINKVTNLLVNHVIFIADNGISNILVHCNMGISRSGTILIRYLQMVYGMSFKEALKFIKK
jgi:protein tyrosine phosphatase